MKNYLTQKQILITGGTSTLGQALVRTMQEADAEVHFTYHANQEVAHELQALGAKGYQVDLARVDAIDAFVKQLRSELATLDVMIHNAASTRDHTLKNMTEEEWDHVFAVNLKAPYYLTKKCLPLLLKCAKQKGVAKVWTLISRAAYVGGVGISNYAASKAGLLGFTKSLAKELGQKKHSCECC